ncbi:MAG: outer membrane protein assembly factor BamD [Acidobacteriaceae bacterium]|jgi:outer membrane protein assembly factor BamD
MTHRSTRSIQLRSFLPDVRITLTGLTAVVLLASTVGVRAQATAPATTPATAQPAAQTTAPKPDIALTNKKPAKVRKQKEDKTVASKDTIKEDKKVQKDNPLLGQDSKLPDKALYDKAEDAIKHGRFDVARLDLQTLLNTYGETQYMMRAKLAIADSWYKEGGTAALTQAEQEYRDFITFFPNAPEAAEAQMRIGDIYFKEMDKPDRDPTATTHAEEEYRLMLQQFPDSPLVPQARQRLREVQETLAQREANIAAFYATHANWPATIARYQTVADTYPLYSHIDDVLIGLGDAFLAEAAITRMMKAPPGATKAQQEMIESSKAHLLKIYDDQAAAALRKVVLEHAASPHVEDAKDRLVGMGLPVPTPTPEQVTASEALENSRGQYTLSKRATLMFLHQADTVQAATIGDPPIEDPKPVSAAAVLKQARTDYIASMTPQGNTPARTALPENTPADSSPTPAAGGPLSLQDVPAAGTGTAPVASSVEGSSPSATSGTGVGLEIVQPSASSPAPTSTTFPGTEAAPAPASAAPAAATPAAAAANGNGGMAPVGPSDATPLAPIEKPAVAPAPINDAAATKQPPAQLPAANGKNPKAPCDKSDQSCSKHKPKKGLAKLNPF